MGVGHDENFPVASPLCPPALRAPIVAIYRFARTADDLADEGEALPVQRRAALADYRRALHDAAAGRVGSAWPAVFGPLAEAVVRHRLPVPLLDRLLDAFVHDTWGAGFDTRAALLAYCRCSAQPVGRLLLHLYGIDDPAALAESDAICSALQLVNFWQDASVDLPRGRCNFPREDLRRHGLDETRLAAQGDTPASRAMVAELSAWAAQTMAAGAALPGRVGGRAGWELRLVVQGGLRVLERIAALQWRTLSRRARLNATDLPLLLWRAVRMRRTGALGDGRLAA